MQQYRKMMQHQYTEKVFTTIETRKQKPSNIIKSWPQKCDTLKMDAKQNPG